MSISKPRREPIVNTIIKKDSSLLVLKRYFYPKNKLDVPGGFVEAGETIRQAAIREVKEETGFEVKIVKKFGKYDYSDRGKKTMHVYIGEIVGGKLKSSREGVPFWMDLKRVKAELLAFPQVHVRVLKDIREYFAKVS